MFAKASFHQDAQSDHHEQRSRWARFLDTVVPTPNPNRLVPVAEVPRAAVPFIEDCFADAEMPVVVREVRTLFATDSRIVEPKFEVLVAARDRAVAAEVVSGF